MSKADLEMYQERKQLIASHQAELDGDLMTTDSVMGSMSEFPYVERAVVIRGRDIKREQWLRQQIYELEERCTRAEAYIANIPEGTMQALLYWHYIQGMSWPKVRKTMRMRDITVDALKKRVQRFFTGA